MPLRKQLTGFVKFFQHEKSYRASLATKRMVQHAFSCEEDDFWERIDQLKNAGAEGILVIPIEKMIV